MVYATDPHLYGVNTVDVYWIGQVKFNDFLNLVHFVLQHQPIKVVNHKVYVFCNWLLQINQMVKFPFLSYFSTVRGPIFTLRTKIDIYVPTFIWGHKTFSWFWKLIPYNIAQRTYDKQRLSLRKTVKGLPCPETSNLISLAEEYP